jgi:hypothetical protein
VREPADTIVDAYLLSGRNAIFGRKRDEGGQVHRSASLGNNIDLDSSFPTPEPAHAELGEADWCDDGTNGYEKEKTECLDTGSN